MGDFALIENALSASSRSSADCNALRSESTLECHSSGDDRRCHAVDIDLLDTKRLHGISFGRSARGKPSGYNCYASNGCDRHDDCRGIERAQLVKQALEDVRRTQSDRDAEGKSDSQQKNAYAYDRPQQRVRVRTEGKADR